MSVGISSTNTSYDDFKSLGLTHKKEEASISKDNKQIGDFMKLFIEQLKHQNPLEPQEGADFLAQISQMQGVEELRNVQQSVKNMSESYQSGMILEATSMIGKSIEVPSNKMMLRTDMSGQAKIINGEVVMPDLSKDDAVNNVKVTIQDPISGAILQEYEFGAQAGGDNIPFAWNGTYVEGENIGERIIGTNGQPIMDGPYNVKAEIQLNGKWRNANTLVTTSIDSVSINNETKDITLNASSVGQVKLSDLKKIYE